MLELLFPRHCAGCQAPGHVLCARCRRDLATPPRRVTPQLLPHVPVFALGPYGGAHRGVILSMKERQHLAVRPFVGAALRAGLEFLEVRGELVAGAGLVPAPTRAASARKRGGDPVAAVCRGAQRDVFELLALGRATADQSELDAAQRRRNLGRGVLVEKDWADVLARVGQRPLLVVDDVVTTGATLQASVEALLAHGFCVVGCVTIAVA